MDKDQWQNLHHELNDLFDEFISKWRKNDYKYLTQRRENDLRVAKIIDITARKILYHKEINLLFFHDMDEDQKTQLTMRGLWEPGKYYGYIHDLLHKIEHKININDL